MNATNQLILNDFSRLLRIHLSENLSDLVLFGSRMTGKAKNDSDYDFLVMNVGAKKLKSARQLINEI